MMVGAIVSWGIAWPLINNRAGSWYPADLPNPQNNFQGAFAYHVRPSSSRTPRPQGASRAPPVPFPTSVFTPNTARSACVSACVV